MKIVMTRRWAIVMIVGCSFFLALLVYAGWVADNLRKELDGHDFCPGKHWKNHVGIERGEHSAMLIDTSNAIPKKDGKAAEPLVEKWVRGLDLFQEISIRSLPQTANTVSLVIAEPWCVTWNKKTASSWSLVIGPIIAELDFIEKFLPTVQVEFKKAIHLPEADESPILETLSALKREGVESVFLVSDMMQNSDIENHYRNSLCDHNCPDITGLTLEVYYIQRENDKVPDNHKQIWEQHVGEEITWHEYSDRPTAQ